MTACIDLMVGTMTAVSPRIAMLPAMRRVNKSDDYTVFALQVNPKLTFYDKSARSVMRGLPTEG